MLRQTDVYLFRVAQMLGLMTRLARRCAAPLLPHGQQAGRGTRPAAVARFRAWLRGRRAERIRRCGPTGRWPGSSPRSRARAAGWPAATQGWSGRSSPRWPDIRPRPSSRSCAPCGPSSGSLPKKEPTRLRHGGGGPGGAVPQAGQGPVGMGPGRRGQDPGSRSNRGSPCGKRDYAIILLAARLGLRSIDVQRLEFSDFDWPGNRLSVLQAKTARRVQLPLLKDVGWAVIDYVRAGTARQRLPAGVPAAHRPGRPVLRAGPPAPDPGQARPGGSRPGERGAPPRHALAAARAGDPPDGGRHASRADRRHPRPPVRRVDGRLPESSLGLPARCALDPDAPAEEQEPR